METPTPLINGERFKYTKVLIGDASKTEHLNITNELKSLDYTYDTWGRIPPYQGIITMTKDGLHLYIEALNPGTYHTIISIFLPDFTIELVDVKIISVENSSSRDNSNLDVTCKFSYRWGFYRFPESSPILISRISRASVSSPIK